MAILPFRTLVKWGRDGTYATITSDFLIFYFIAESQTMLMAEVLDL